VSRRLGYRSERGKVSRRVSSVPMILTTDVHFVSLGSWSISSTSATSISGLRGGEDEIDIALELSLPLVAGLSTLLSLSTARIAALGPAESGSGPVAEFAVELTPTGVRTLIVTLEGSIEGR
jgi:hypothetical protein